MIPYQLHQILQNHLKLLLCENAKNWFLKPRRTSGKFYAVESYLKEGEGGRSSTQQRGVLRGGLASRPSMQSRAGRYVFYAVATYLEPRRTRCRLSPLDCVEHFLSIYVESTWTVRGFLAFLRNNGFELL